MFSERRRTGGRHPFNGSASNIWCNGKPCRVRPMGRRGGRPRQDREELRVRRHAMADHVGRIRLKLQARAGARPKSKRDKTLPPWGRQRFRAANRHEPPLKGTSRKLACVGTASRVIHGRQRPNSACAHAGPVRYRLSDAHIPFQQRTGCMWPISRWVEKLSLGSRAARVAPRLPSLRELIAMGREV